jgi:hypothetical protein
MQTIMIVTQRSKAQNEPSGATMFPGAMPSELVRHSNTIKLVSVTVGVRKSVLLNKTSL